MATHAQTYFHPVKDSDFNYEKFYNSIFSFTDPIIQGENIHFTTIFIHKEHGGKGPYASYRIRDKLKREKAFEDEAKYLESYKIYLDDKPENEIFAIYNLYNQFKNKEIVLESSLFRKEPLDRYFGPWGENIPTPEKNMSNLNIKDIDSFKKNEAIYVKHLLEDLKPQQAYFLPLPIFAFGNPVGIIYLLYNENDLRAREGGELIDFKRYYRLLILNATREYERIILEAKFNRFYLKPQDALESYWHIFKDLNKEYYIKGERQNSKDIRYNFLYEFVHRKEVNILTENDFLLSLGYDDYYSHQAKVTIEEINHLRLWKREKIFTAIISIIVDSFAHNIGAHSLVALKWWFETRYKIAARKFPVSDSLSVNFNPEQVLDQIRANMADTVEFHASMDDKEHINLPDQLSLLNIVRFMDKTIISQLWEYRDREEVITQFPIPVTQSIYYFFQYLRDKSAFWSGVARDTPFSGQSKSWPDILKDFLNNTLFLGTIAHTEGINKVHVHVEILNENGINIIGGKYAEINLEVIKQEREDQIGFGNLEFAKEKIPYSPYAFLRMGENFDEIQKVLNKLKAVFFPNGIIGQHAFYTLLENTLRNIKHYKKDLAQISKSGVSLFISIQQVGFLQRMDDNPEEYRKKYHEQEEFTFKEKYKFTDRKPLYKVSTWLHHKQKLYNEVGAKINEEPKQEPFHPKGSVIGAHTQQLRRRVVNEDGFPILGGSSQDKVCAAMLMNNRFRSIDDVRLDEVKRQYFPYVFASSEYYQSLDEQARDKGFKAKDVFLHKSYNEKLTGKNPGIRLKNYKKYLESYIDEISSEEHKEQGGIIKKTFHVWLGEKCILIDENFNARHENTSRFQILAVKSYMKNGKKLLFRNKGGMKKRKESAEYYIRNQGIIRVVEAEDNWDTLNDQKLFETAMLKWLGEWLGNGYEEVGVILCRETTDPNPKQADTKDIPRDHAKPVWQANLRKKENSWVLNCENSIDISATEVLKKIGLDTVNIKKGRTPISALREIKNPAFQDLLIEHAAGVETQNQYACRLRSHTSFFKDLFEACDFRNFMEKEFLKEKDNPLKLLETLLTQITIFDSRIFERIGDPKYRKENQEKDTPEAEKPFSFVDQLRINAYPEDPDVFRNERKKFLSKESHFIVMHLSFLEQIYKSKFFDLEGEEKKKIAYSEKEVNEFYRDEIKHFFEEVYFPQKKMPPNVILVITSGRGRGDWFNATEHPQITFRPIEAFLKAVEDGLSLRDDFQVKYNLCNVLFGS